MSNVGELSGPVYLAPCSGCGGMQTEHNVHTGKCLVSGCGIIDPNHPFHDESATTDYGGTLSGKMMVLISARRNSKYLAKFLFGLYDATANPRSLDVRVMLNEHDTWNTELAAYFEGRPDAFNKITFYRENMQLGRAGLHYYFNELLKDPHDSDWFVYFCEDHFITMADWDYYVQSYIHGTKRSADSEGKEFPINPDDIWVLVPKFDNCGAMNHILSRGFVKTLHNKIGNHGWIDSYINDLMVEFPDRVIRMDDEMLHDFTHDDPSPMHDSQVQSLNSEKGKLLPAHGSDAYHQLIKEDRERISRAIHKKEARNES